LYTIARPPTATGNAPDVGNDKIAGGPISPAGGGWAGDTTASPRCGLE